MSQFVAYYDEEPIELKAQVELHQLPIRSASGARSVEEAIRPSVVYVQVPSEAGPFLVPFGEYDKWSLRDRYSEAIRIVNTLGASSTTCETYREVSARRGIRAKVLSRGGHVSRQRVEISGFDFLISTMTAREALLVTRGRCGGLTSLAPGFAAAVSSVLDNSASEVAVNVKSNRSHSVDGDLGLTLSKVGFELSAGTQQSGATRLHIRASFPKAKRLWR